MEEIGVCVTGSRCIGPGVGVGISIGIEAGRSPKTVCIGVEIAPQRLLTMDKKGQSYPWLNNPDRYCFAGASPGGGVGRGALIPPFFITGGVEPSRSFAFFFLQCLWKIA